MTGKHIVCFSGGEGSGLAAVEVFRRFGADNLILLNHDISASVEDSDIKRFKEEIANYCKTPITYANHPNWDTKDQFDIVVEAGAFKVGTGTALCTSRLKTEPFYKWLKENEVDATCVLYYGFSSAEPARIQRRSSILGLKGYTTGYPLLWERTIKSTLDIGITPPNVYNVFKHANCVGCLKAGMQHWYVVYCLRPDIWKRGIWAEEEIGYSIIKNHFLLDLEPKFKQMRKLGVVPTERINAVRFWFEAKKLIEDVEEDGNLPCECIT